MAEHEVPYDGADSRSPQAEGSVAQILPEFTTAVRGYDRAQVDEYITRLQDWVADSEERARAAEFELAQAEQQTQALNRQLMSMQRQSGLPTPESVTTYANRMKEVMTQAVSAAQSFRDEAFTESDAIRLTAQEEGGAIVEQAHDEAAQLLRAAQVENRNLRQEITELLATRERVVAELEELQNQLSQLLHRPASSVPSDVIAEPVHVEPIRIDAPEEHLAESEQTGELPMGAPKLFDQEA